MTKTAAKKTATKKSTPKKPATKEAPSKKPTASYAGQVLIGLAFPMVDMSLKDVNSLELCCLGFIAAGTVWDLKDYPNHYTVDHIYLTIATHRGKNVQRTEVVEAFEKLNRRRLIKKNLMKNLDGSSEKYFTLSPRGEKLLNIMQCELWSVIERDRMKA